MTMHWFIYLMLEYSIQANNVKWPTFFKLWTKIKGQMNQNLAFFSFESTVFNLRIKETYSKVSNELDEAFRRFWNVKITVFQPS